MLPGQLLETPTSTRGKLSPQIGVRSGEEFRAARRAAEGCDAQLVLGDRPIEVTLRRAWDALSLAQRWRLGRRLASRCAGGSAGPGTSCDSCPPVVL